MQIIYHNVRLLVLIDRQIAFAKQNSKEISAFKLNNDEAVEFLENVDNWIAQGWVEKEYEQNSLYYIYKGISIILPSQSTITRTKKLLKG